MGGREEAAAGREDEEGEEEEGEDIKVKTCSGTSRELVTSETQRQEAKKILCRFVWTGTTSVACSTPQVAEAVHPRPRAV